MNQSFQALTDSQWQVIQQILDDKCHRWHSLCDIIDAILWLNYTGVQWRKLPKMTGPSLPWQTVYYQSCLNFTENPQSCVNFEVRTSNKHGNGEHAQIYD